VGPIFGGSADAVYQVAGSYANVGNGWFADIRTRVLHELSGCCAKAGTAARKS